MASRSLCGHMFSFLLSAVAGSHGKWMSSVSQSGSPVFAFPPAKYESSGFSKSLLKLFNPGLLAPKPKQQRDRELKRAGRWWRLGWAAYLCEDSGCRSDKNSRDMKLCVVVLQMEKRRAGNGQGPLFLQRDSVLVQPGGGWNGVG